MKKFKNLFYIVIITIIFSLLNYKLFNTTLIKLPFSLFGWIIRIIYLSCISLFGINFYYDILDFEKNNENVKRNYKGFYIIVLSLIVNLVFSLLFGRDTLLGYNLNSKDLLEGICDLIALLLYFYGVKIQIKDFVNYQKN